MTLHSVLFFYIWAAGLGGWLLASDSRNGDGAFANKNCPQGRACDQFFQMLGVFPEVCRGGMLAAGIYSHITMPQTVA